MEVRFLCSPHTPHLQRACWQHEAGSPGLRIPEGLHDVCYSFLRIRQILHRLQGKERRKWQQLRRLGDVQKLLSALPPADEVYLDRWLRAYSSSFSVISTPFLPPLERTYLYHLSAEAVSRFG